MPNLRYKTPEMDPPSSYLSVYFCAHPDDFELYFDEIVKKVFAVRGLTIWYGEEAYPYELERMKLFIVPITKRLFSSDTQNELAKIQFAQSKHIPILPIVCEENLDELYMEYFGNLQYLLIEELDETKLSFHEKLDRYLKDDLLSCLSLYPMVRKAFQGKIFVSYRKKDNRYMKNLLTAIHDYMGMESFSVWYDEYLTPGEDFNDSIKEVLLESDIVILMVTPNLINEDNYVKNIEYPMALNAKKYILPIEVEKTDQHILRQQFPGLGEIYSIKKEATLHYALAEFLQDTNRWNIELDPEQTYWIGQAYLNGIDVEKDIERGLSLIKDAAEHGSNEATTAMSEMYHDGKMVKRDLLQAVKWAEKSVSNALFLFMENKQYVRTLLTDLYMCGSYYEEMGDITTAMSKYTSAVGYLGYLEKGDEYLYPELHKKMGDLSEKEGNHLAALWYYQQCAKFSKKRNDQITLSSLYWQMAEIYDNEDEFEQAQNYFLQAIECYEHNYFVKGQRYFQRVLAEKYWDVGYFYYQYGEKEKAIHYFELSMKHRDEIAEITNNPKDIKRVKEECYAIYEAYIELAEEAYKKKQNNQAKNCYDQGLKCLHKLLKKEEKEKYYHECGITLVRLARVAPDVEKRSYLETAVRFYDSLYETYKKPIYAKHRDLIKEQIS